MSAPSPPQVLHDRLVFCLLCPSIHSLSSALPKDGFYDLVTLTPVEGTGHQVTLTDVNYTTCAVLPLQVAGANIARHRLLSLSLPCAFCELHCKFLCIRDSICPHFPFLPPITFTVVNRFSITATSHFPILSPEQPLPSLRLSKGLVHT